jgi:dienelactone hydrolase
VRRTLPLLILVALAIGGGWLVTGAGPDVRRTHVTSAGVPLDVIQPSGGGPHPGVVVAHGFAGSARLMAPFGDTLAARGYTVVLLDFTGHGANTRPLPDQAAGTASSTQALQRDVEAAVVHLRSLPDVDPARIALVGHSMGAGAVTRYAAAHPDVAATVAISLPDSAAASAEGPARLLTLVGALEFPGFHEAAAGAAAQRDDRAVHVVPGVEHITVLYAPEAHRETVAWLDQAFGAARDGGGIPFPGRRLVGAFLLVLAFLLGFHPLTALLTGESTGSWPPSGLRTTRLVPAVTGVAVVGVVSAVAAVAALFLPVNDLPLAIAGYVAGYAAVIGVLLLAYDKWFLKNVARRTGRLRLLLIVPYAIVAIAVPVHLGLTHAVPAGDRWWLLLIVWAAFALFAYAAERVTRGVPLHLLAIAAVFVVVLAAAAVTGLTHGFVILVLFPLIGLLLWQTWWSAVLNRFAVPAWMIAVTGAVVVAWPLAVTLPLTG